MGENFVFHVCTSSCIYFLLIGAGNVFVNERMGRTIDFINLTIHSYIQMTSWQYGQMIISVLLFLFFR